MKWTHIFFDLDGTLTKSGAGIVNCVKYALEKFSIFENDFENLKKFIDPPLLESFKNFYGFSEEDARKAVSFYRERFSKVGIFENEVYEGIPETLKKLKDSGKKLYVATSKPEIYVPKILSHFDLAKYFVFAGGSDIAETRKDKASVIQFVIEENHLEKEARSRKIVMVGDRKHDAIGAAKNKIDFAGVLWGYGTREELEENGATKILESVKDLLEM